MLPGRKSLAEEYGVGLPTLERAVALLLADGTLRADLGRGTFVAESFVRVTANVTCHPSPEQNETHQTHAPVRERRATLGILSAQAPLYPEQLDESSGDWSAVVIRALEQSFSHSGGATRFATTRMLPDGTMSPSLSERASSLLEDGVDALAILNVTDFGPVARELMGALGGRKTPAIVIAWDDVIESGGLLPHVLYDNRYAGYRAAQHLLESGYSPLFFVPQAGEAYSDERLSGARSAVRDTGLPPETLSIFAPGDTHHTRTRLAGEGSCGDVRLLLESARALSNGKAARTPGIIAARDQIALGVLSAAAEMGMAAGREFGIVGFDDAPLARENGLTTLRTPLEAMAAEAARQLLAALEGIEPAQQLRLRSHLVVRASTCTSPKTPT